MAEKLRDRTTVDLGGLAPAVRAHAEASGMAVSSLARLAIARMLESAGVAVEAHGMASSKTSADPSVRVSLRMSRRIAREMATRAWTFGLSQGTYVAALIGNAPIATDHREAVSALGVSNDQLAASVADLREVLRLARRGSSSPTDLLWDNVQEVTDDVRRHLGAAARLMAELQPIAALLRREAPRPDGGQTGS